MEAEFRDYEANQKWPDIFNNIRARAEKLSTRDSSRNRHLNRYLDVVPYDCTRVKIERNSLNYINASHVNVIDAERKYILTQGPLKHTSGHFWAMIWEQNTKGILMLNKIIEAGHVKCHQYWPDGVQNGDEDEYVFDDVNLKVSLESSERENAYILRKLLLTDLITGESRTVFHFHYILWPDFDLPESSDSFLQYLNAVRSSGCLDADKFGPSVIHCSAGIGRSGTFVLVDSCLVMIEKNQCRDSINVIDILLEMRKCRMGLIQTPGQLRFSFQAIIEGSKQFLVNGNNHGERPKSATKIMRMLGVTEDEASSTSDDQDNDNFDDDMNELLNNDSHKNEQQTETQESDADSTNDDHNQDASGDPDSEKKKRDADREERRTKMMDQINRMKRKKIEVEERLKFNQKLVNYVAPAVCLGVAICIGIYAFARKHHDASL